MLTPLFAAVKGPKSLLEVTSHESEALGYQTVQSFQAGSEKVTDVPTQEQKLFRWLPRPVTRAPEKPTRPVAREMISSAHQTPLTLWTTAVSSSSSSSTSFSIASSSLHSSLFSCFTSSSSYSSPSLISSFLPLFVSLSCLFLPHRGSGSSKSKRCPSHSSPFKLLNSYCAFSFLVFTLTTAGAFPADYQNKSKISGMIDRHSNGVSLVLYRNISISTAGVSGSENSSTPSSGLLNSYQGDQPHVTIGSSYQGDQPPRRTTKSKEFHRINQLTQGRVFYLRASNDQYIQVYNRKVTGTFVYQPVLVDAAAAAVVTAAVIVVAIVVVVLEAVVVVIVIIVVAILVVAIIVVVVAVVVVVVVVVV
ncbi:LOW QUALITY PROTEIN: hypothetical protein ElyMa_001941100 [Elysia marginata]|uniref:Uncharacterized protein n=1 Tax=Elysia marginata TaxID=1093978 RepID=A0AAV4EXH7_9GAST|nr:LOW QUALITY PROTEIN: hypothetical protein ElyMa_001941100 [Elysia marginata]